MARPNLNPASGAWFSQLPTLPFSAPELLPKFKYGGQHNQIGRFGREASGFPLEIMEVGFCHGRHVSSSESISAQFWITWICAFHIFGLLRRFRRKHIGGDVLARLVACLEEEDLGTPRVGFLDMTDFPLAKKKHW